MMEKTTNKKIYRPVEENSKEVKNYIEQVLQREAVATKDGLTNKVDRCVTGRVAQQQCVGELQLPLSNCGVMALDYTGQKGIATSIGHAPVSALIDPKKGSNTAIAACTGIAGSTTIGDNFTIGGGVGINGHITICNNVNIHGMSMITKSITKEGDYASALAADSVRNWRRNQVILSNLYKKTR